MRYLTLLLICTLRLTAGEKLGLQLFYETAADEAFALEEGQKLTALVARLAPAIELDLYVTLAPNPKKSFQVIAGQRRLVPMQQPTLPQFSALLLTHQPIGAQGFAGPPAGALSIPLMQEKTRAGGDSADITIHEWLHTLTGRKVNGHVMPDPHSNAAHGYAKPTRVGADGQDNWDEWYAWLLRG